MNTAPFITCVALAAALSACGPDRDVRDARDASAAPLSCNAMPKGWVPAVAVSPDVVPPCNSGSTGTCPGPGYRYVRGTGWCKPA